MPRLCRSGEQLLSLLLQLTLSEVLGGLPYLQILVKHIQSILPDLRARINAQVVTLQKELVSYGEVTESKVRGERRLCGVGT